MVHRSSPTWDCQRLEWEGKECKKGEEGFLSQNRIKEGAYTTRGREAFWEIEYIELIK